MPTKAKVYAQVEMSAPLAHESASPIDWNCERYLKFESEPTRAARDLLAQIPRFEAKSVVDLGCGPGNSTELLATAFPAARLIGVDNSENMLATARHRVPMAEFVKDDIEHWKPQGSVDLIFANASLHFVVSHRALLPHLISCLSKSGLLAVQMPRNTHELSHAAMRMVAADGPWAPRLVPVAKTRANIGPVDEYYNLLRPLCHELDIWETSYVYPLNGVDEVVQWFEGSGLRPFLELLSEDEQASFIDRYREKLDAYPRQLDGKLLLRYPRLFFVLRK